MPSTDQVYDGVDHGTDKLSARLVTGKIAAAPASVPIPKATESDRILDAPARKLCSYSRKGLVVTMFYFVDARPARRYGNEQAPNLL
jgi:hypothetical protein